MARHKIFDMAVSAVYPHYVNKAEKKGKTAEQVDELMCWLTGYSQDELHEQLEANVSFEKFFDQAPKLHPNRTLIKGVICGKRVEDIEDPLMQNIRYLDKLIDELARGKKIQKYKTYPIIHINRGSSLFIHTENSVLIETIMMIRSFVYIIR